MNVFLHELRLRFKGQVLWFAALCVFMLLSVVKFDTLAQDAAASQALLKQFPATIQALFGMTGLDLATLSGYFGVMFVYILLILSVHAGMLGAGLLADEERDKTTEFLFVKPRGRSRIVTAKLLAGFVYLSAQWLVVLVTTFVAVWHIAGHESFLPNFWLFMTALGIVQLTIYSLGLFFAAATKNPKWPPRFVALVVFVSYLVFALVKLMPSLAALQYVSIFSYFDATSLLQRGSLDGLYVTVCAAVAAACLAGTYTYYRRRDLNV